MKLVTINMELVIDDAIDFTDKEMIADYLNDKLFLCCDPEFFNGIGAENIASVTDIDD